MSSEIANTEPTVTEGMKAEDVELDGEERLDPEQLRREFQAKAQSYLVEQTNHVVIPSFSKWFDLDKISTIEEKLFPDILLENHQVSSAYKTRDSYKNMRDFMINCYRLNPREYLTVTAVRRNLCGDVTTIIRIHQFLEKWGLINYQLDPRTKPSLVGPQYTGHFQITLDTPTGLVPYLPEDDKKKEVKEVTSTKKSQQYSEVKSSYNMEIRKNIYSTDSKQSFITPNIVNYSCNVCGKDTTESRYHNLKIKSYSHNATSTINNASVLCQLCYDQGLFPSNFHNIDYIKLSKNHKQDLWSEQEILLLLEGIEMFGTYEPTNINGNINANANSQWDKIAEHVASKSREQCIIKFIQLPIEDKYLSKLIDSGNGSKQDDKSSNESLILEIVKQLLTKQEGTDLITNNVNSELKVSAEEQTNLINQISELTLTKLNLKLKKIDNLQDNILKIEHQLDLERKQVLIERWIQFEKIQKLKTEKPELAEFLDDLMKPVKINEVNKALNPQNQNDSHDQMNIDTNENNGVASEKLPISVIQPKSYQYWSG